MHSLFFEDTWQRTIADQDRQQIEQAFIQIKEKKERALFFLWEATNYKGERLVTALIHNPSDDPFVIDQLPIAYTDQLNDHLLHTFQLAIALPPHTSMPWTFIFPPSDAGNLSPAYKILPFDKPSDR